MDKHRKLLSRIIMSLTVKVKIIVASAIAARAVRSGLAHPRLACPSSVDGA